MFFIAYTFKGQVHVFAGRVKIVSHSSCRTSTILKYFLSPGEELDLLFPLDLFMFLHGRETYIGVGSFSIMEGGGGAKPARPTSILSGGGDITKCTYTHACTHTCMYMLLNDHTHMHACVYTFTS